MAAARSLQFVCVLLGALAAPLSAQNISLSAPGAEEDLAARLEAASLLLQPQDDAQDAPRTAQDIVAAARADYARLLGALYDQGYFAPVVSIRLDGQEAAALSPLSTPTRIDTVAITVEPGEAFRLSSADIGPLAPGTTLPTEFRPGGAATTPLLQDTARAAIERWRDQGHAVADVADQRIRADNRNASLAVDITLDPGALITFGALRPSGQERMRPERIIEIAGLPTGLTFSPQAIARAEERLRDTGVFSAVALQEGSPDDSDVMSIEARVVEAPLRRFGFGANLSSDSGGELTAFWVHRNLFGGAERLRIEGALTGIGQGELSTQAISGIDAELRLRYSRPATVTTDTTVYAELFAVGIEEPDFRLAGIGTEIGFSHILSPNLDAGLGIGITTNIIEDAFGERSASLITLPGEITWDNRDDALDPTSGFYAAAAATPFVTAGAGAGARFSLDARGYLSFGPQDRSRIAARLQYGALVGGDLDSLPPDYLFWSGGAGTVRGQDYASLGAVQNGFDSGGRGFFGASGEFRQDIGDTNFGLVAFVDAGFVATDPIWQDESDWHAGAGVGLRYATPFGPIRIDLATPVRGPGVGEDIFLYIGIGQAF